MLCGTPRAARGVAAEELQARIPLAAPASTTRATAVTPDEVVPEPTDGACGAEAEERPGGRAAAHGRSPGSRGSRSQSRGRGRRRPRETGTVNSWIVEKQFGFVSCSSKNRPDLFLHADNFKSLDQRERAKTQGLRRGDRVAFHIREAEAGRRSDDAVDAEVLDAARPPPSRSPIGRREDSWRRRHRDHGVYEEVEWQWWRTKRWSGRIWRPGRTSTQKDEVMTLPVNDVRFTHADIKREFKDGRQYEELIGDLESGKLDPLSARFLQLRGFRQDSRGPHHPAVYFCSNNRRLHCLREFQARHPERKVEMRLIVQTFEGDAKKAIQALTTVNGGATVRVRGPGS